MKNNFKGLEGLVHVVLRETWIETELIQRNYRYFYKS